MSTRVYGIVVSCAGNAKPAGGDPSVFLECELLHAVGYGQRHSLRNAGRTAIA